MFEQMSKLTLVEISTVNPLLMVLGIIVLANVIYYGGLHVALISGKRKTGK